MSAKLGSVTESVFEFIYNQNANGIKLHEFDIISRFENIIGYTETLQVLSRLSQKKHLLTTTSTKKSSRGRQTYYYRVDPNNPYFEARTGGRKADPEKMKKLESMREKPFVTEDPVADTKVVDQQIALEKREVTSPNVVQESWTKLITAKAPQTTATTPAVVNGVDVVGGTAKLEEVILESSEAAEARGAVMLMLDLGNSRTEMVDAQTAHRLYCGLHAVFGKRS